MVSISGSPRRFVAASFLCLLAAPFVGAAPTLAASPSASSVSAKALCPPATKPGTVSCLALVRTDVAARSASSDEPATTLTGGFGPADPRSAHALPSTSAGSGMTVAVVDAHDSPNAETYMNAYRTQFGLGACTTANGCFRKVNEYGYAGSNPSYSAGWEGEISLNLDMVSTICPKCHTLLVEADDAYTRNLGTAVNTAVYLGAIAVSNSYGAPEFATETIYDQYYNHPGVAITVSTGDCGYDDRSGPSDRAGQ